MAVTPSDLTGMYKQVYGDDITNLIPRSAKLIKEVPFVSKEKQTGDLYHQPVVTSYPHGVTYAARGSGAFTLNAAVAMKMQDAQIGGSQICLVENIPYETAARAVREGPAAFKDATKFILSNLMERAGKAIELESFYGQSPTGVGTIASSANVVVGSTTDIVLTTGQWAAGIWAGMENCKINIVNTTDSQWVGSGTALTGAAAADDVFTISTVTNSTRTLRITGTATGIGNLDTAAGTKSLYIVFNGEYGTSTTANGMAGIDKILTNTGTLFNISASTYNLWKANTQTVSGQMTMQKLLAGVDVAVQRGLDEDVAVWLYPTTWSNLNADLAANRRFDGSYSRSKLESGTEAITYYGQNGAIRLIPHNIIKEGELYILPMKRLMRCGARELSFKTPGMGDDIFLHNAGVAGFEVRCYTDQAVFLETPARAVKVSGFTNV